MPVKVGISTDREDKKIMEKEKKKRFEGAGTRAYERNKEYQKEHYKRLNIVLKRELLEQSNQAAGDAGMSKNGWIVDAILAKLKKQDS